MRNWLVAGASAAALLLGAQSSHAASLADHRALYKMSLARTNAASDVQGLTGEMMLEVKSTCEGSTVTQLLRTDTWGDDEVVQQGELTVSSFETNDGKSFQFTLHNEINGHVVSDFKGSAKRDSADKSAAIKYEHDAFPDATLPAGGVFPNQYMAQLLDAADQNQRVVSVTVFDGSDESKIFRSTSIIGPKDSSDKSAAAPLKGMAHWPMVLSYFDVAGDSITPDYESSFDLYENGVSDHVLLDYGDFAMRGR